MPDPYGLMTEPRAKQYSPLPLVAKRVGGDRCAKMLPGRSKSPKIPLTEVGGLFSKQLGLEVSANFVGGIRSSLG